MPSPGIRFHSNSAPDAILFFYDKIFYVAVSVYADDLSFIGTADKDGPGDRVKSYAFGNQVLFFQNKIYSISAGTCEE
jgi:hypothetical protein